MYKFLFSLDKDSSSGSIVTISPTIPPSSPSRCGSVQLFEETLLKNASPTLSSPSRCGSNQSFHETFLNMPSPTLSDETPRQQQLKYKLMKLKLELKKRRDQNYRLNKKLKSLSKWSVVEELLKNHNKFAKNFVKMQLFHKKRSNWNLSEKEIALSIFYKSPSCYKFLRSKGIVLPGITTIQSWLKIYNLKTGVDTILIEKLADKVKYMSDGERECVLLFDEITIKKGISYNRYHDYIEGYEDLSSIGRKPLYGSQALVLMVRGLLYKWKIPISYYISAQSVTSSNLNLIIKLALEKLFKIGLKIRVITCDQGSNNRSLYYKYLNICEEKPYFYHNGYKIYTLFDIPHLIKSIRNNLMNENISFETECGQNLIASWQDIQLLFNIDSKSTTYRATPKLTYKHIHPNNFQKMRVKLATQIFSRSVSNAMKAAIISGELNTSTAQGTTIFIQLINDLFDSFNSKVLNDPNPLKCAISVFNNNVLSNIEKCVTSAKTFKVYKKDGQVKQNIYCFKGIVLTMKATIMLWNDLKFENKKYLLTNRLQQDPIENLFSVIRSKGGYNFTPTCREFRIALQHNIHIRLQSTTGNSNCEVDEDEDLILDQSLDSAIIDSSLSISNVTDSEVTVDEEVANVTHETTDIIQQPNLETFSIVYVTGYLINSVLKINPCDNCYNFFCKTDEKLDATECLIYLKDYGVEDNMVKYLKRPSETILRISTELLNIFHSKFNELKCEHGLIKTLFDSSLNILSIKFQNFFKTDDPCHAHKLFFIRKFMFLNIFKSLKWESDMAQKPRKSKNTSSNRKIRILESN